MDNKKQPLSDEQFDEMLRVAVSESVEKEMSVLPPDEETERLYPFSERHEQRMTELFGQKRRRDFFILRRPLKIALIVEKRALYQKYNPLKDEVWEVEKIRQGVRDIMREETRTPQRTRERGMEL